MVIKVEFDKEFERKFRQLAMKKYGYSKGAIKKASREAISIWIEVEDKELPKLNNPAKVIRGVMKNLRGKYSSVELQHETTI
ncbi:hypothetical protein J4462_02240 [Candidatus Pacearchaeota archaeon]|nr:hypothetical protein [Candidatus Pacearchaeota archaeon]